MLVYYYNSQKIKQYTYKVITTVAAPYLPLSLVKEHLRLDLSDTSQDDYLTMIVASVFEYAQKYTGRTFLTTTYETYRDNFHTFEFVLRRSPLQSVNSITYYNQGILNTLPSTDYYNTLENDYSKVVEFADGPMWPQNIDKRLQNIKITFTAGYGDDYTSIPSDLVLALLNHIANFYQNRGDCGGESTGGCGACLTPNAKLVYDLYRIVDLTGLGGRC